MTGYTPIYNLPYVEASDLVASYPTVSEELAENIETALGGLGGGLTHIHTETFTSVASVSVNNVFTSAYENYRVICQLSASSTNLELRFRTRLSGSDDTGNNYYTSEYYIGTTGAAAGSTVGGAVSSWYFFTATDPADTNSYAAIDLFGPLSGKRKQGAGMASLQNPSSVGYGAVKWHNKIVTTNYDGLTLFTSTGTCTGVLRIYGYQN